MIMVYDDFPKTFRARVTAPHSNNNNRGLTLDITINGYSQEIFELHKRRFRAQLLQGAPYIWL